MEDVTLLHVLSTLPAGQSLLAIGDVTDKVEIIDISHALIIFQFLQVDAILTHHIRYLALALCGIPLQDEIIDRGEGIVDILLRIVGNALRA